MGFLLFVAGRWYEAQRCSAVEVIIDRSRNPRALVGRREVLDLLTANGGRPVVGRLFSSLNLQRLEERVEAYPLVKDCQIARDLRGNLLVKVLTYRPLARLIHPDRHDTRQDVYLSESGNFMPLSQQYTDRVMLLSGAYFEHRRNLQAPRDSALLAFIRRIDGDSLWRAEVAWMDVNHEGEVTLYPQIGDIPIEFGAVTDVERKLSKIKLIYQRILPIRGWDYFSKIVVKYHNQIVGIRADTAAVAARTAVPPPPDDPAFRNNETQ